MIVLRSVDELTPDGGSVVTVGTFDGVHRAHGEIVREVVHRARVIEGRSVVITFDPHPREVVGKGQPVRLLTTMEERVGLLGELGIDVLLVIPFTYEFSRQSSRKFYERYVVNGVRAAEVVVGYDHMFGRDREAGIEELIRIGKTFNFSVFAVHPYSVDGEVVSSTIIRNALESGDVERAGKFLGYPYSITGRVVRGDGRGKSLGYPTANLIPVSEKKIVPGRGVYLVSVDFTGNRYFGMMNIGVLPTISEGRAQTVEVHLLHFSGDLYGETLTVKFLRRLRDEQKFASMQELVVQMGRDKEESLRHIETHLKRQ